jgi:hypothetical protein
MFSNTRTLMTLTGAAVLALAYSAAPANAYIFDFKEVREGTNAGFAFSYWHAASSNGGKSGPIIAVFGDAPGGATTNTFNPISGTYNTNTGVVTNLTMTIYTPSTATIGGQTVTNPGNPVGVLTLNGQLGSLGSWNQNNNLAQGFLNFNATFFDNSNSVYSWLTATPTTSNGVDGGGFAGVDNMNGTYTVTGAHYFNDTFYMGTGPSTHSPNSIDVDDVSGNDNDLLDPFRFADNEAVMALWGGSLANPALVGGTYVHSNTNTTLGIDLWLDLDGSADPTSTPEPAAVALLGISLMGLGFAARRRRK